MMTSAFELSPGKTPECQYQQSEKICNSRYQDESFSQQLQQLHSLFTHVRGQISHSRTK